MTEMEELEKKLGQLEAECAMLREENARLRYQLNPPEQATVQYAPAKFSSSLDQTSSADEKIELFRQLFRGRGDIYPLRWENRKGKSGYSPACANEWNRALCGKPKVLSN